MTVKLIHLQNSQSLRVLWCLKYLEVDYELEVVPRRKDRQYPELSAVHPLGKAPLLVIDGRVYAESRLCLEELRARFGPKTLVKQDPDDRYHDDYFAEMGTATLTVWMMILLTFDLIAKACPWYLAPVGSLFRLCLARLLPSIEPPLALMEEHLASNAYFGGTTLGMSDFVMSWPVDLGVARKYFPLGKYPNLSRWHDRIRSSESYRAAVKETGVYDLTQLSA